MFQFLKLLKKKVIKFCYSFFSPQAINSVSPKKPKVSSSPSRSQSKKDPRLNRDRATYNQRTEVKAKKKLLYLKNKARYYQNKKHKRDLNRKLKEQS